MENIKRNIECNNNMILYRLVNSENDPIIPGEYLIRISDKNKLGRGIYFAVSEIDAKNFNKSKHGYNYTHLLKCQIPYQQNEFLDLIKNPNYIAVWATADIKNRKTNTYEKFRNCKEHCFRGLIWSSISSHEEDNWTEVVLYEQYVNQNVLIIESKTL